MPPKKDAAAQLKNEETASIGSPVRRSSRLSIVNSPAPAAVKGRRASATETSSTPKVVKSRRLSQAQHDKETELTKPAKKAIQLTDDSSTTKRQTKSSKSPDTKETARRGRKVSEELSPKRDHNEDPAPRQIRGRRSSVSKAEDTKSNVPRTTRSRRTSLAKEDEKETHDDTATKPVKERKPVAKSEEKDVSPRPRGRPRSVAKKEVEPESEVKEPTRSRRRSTDTSVEVEPDLKTLKLTPIKSRRRPSIAESTDLDPITENDEKEKQESMHLTPIKVKKPDNLCPIADLSIISEQDDALNNSKATPNNSIKQSPRINSSTDASEIKTPLSKSILETKSSEKSDKKSLDKISTPSSEKSNDPDANFHIGSDGSFQFNLNVSVPISDSDNPDVLNISKESAESNKENSNSNLKSSRIDELNESNKRDVLPENFNSPSPIKSTPKPEKYLSVDINKMNISLKDSKVKSMSEDYEFDLSSDNEDVAEQNKSRTKNKSPKTPKALDTMAHMSCPFEDENPNKIRKLSLSHKSPKQLGDFQSLELKESPKKDHGHKRHSSNSSQEEVKQSGVDNSFTASNTFRESPRRMLISNSNSKENIYDLNNSKGSLQTVLSPHKNFTNKESPKRSPSRSKNNSSTIYIDDGDKDLSNSKDVQTVSPSLSIQQRESPARENCSRNSINSKGNIEAPKGNKETMSSVNKHMENVKSPEKTPTCITNNLCNSKENAETMSPNESIVNKSPKRTPTRFRNSLSSSNIDAPLNNLKENSETTSSPNRNIENVQSPLIRPIHSRNSTSTSDDNLVTKENPVRIVSPNKNIKNNESPKRRSISFSYSPIKIHVSEKQLNNLNLSGNTENKDSPKRISDGTRNSYTCSNNINDSVEELKVSSANDGKSNISSRETTRNSLSTTNDESLKYATKSPNKSLGQENVVSPNKCKESSLSPQKVSSSKRKSNLSEDVNWSVEHANVGLSPDKKSCNFSIVDNCSIQTTEKYQNKTNIPSSRLNTSLKNVSPKKTLPKDHQDTVIVLGPNKNMQVDEPSIDKTHMEFKETSITNQNNSREESISNIQQSTTKNRSRLSLEKESESIESPVGDKDENLLDKAPKNIPNSESEEEICKLSLEDSDPETGTKSNEIIKENPTNSLINESKNLESSTLKSLKKRFSQKYSPEKSTTECINKLERRSLNENSEGMEQSSVATNSNKNRNSSNTNENIKKTNENRSLEDRVFDLCDKMCDELSEEEEIDNDQNSFIDDMASEGEEDTPSENSNDIVEVGESLHSTDSEENSVFEDDESDDSFICDDEEVQLLSGDEYDLSDFENEDVTNRKNKKKSPRKKIMKMLYDGNTDEEVESLRKELLCTDQKDKKSRIIPNEASTDDEVETFRKELSDYDKEIKNRISSSPKSTLPLDDKPHAINKDTLKSGDDAIILDDTPQSNTSTSKSRGRKASINIQENIKVDEIKDTALSERINLVVETFCSTIRKGEISVNLSLDYAESDDSNSKEKEFPEHVERNKSLNPENSNEYLKPGNSNESLTDVLSGENNEIFNLSDCQIKQNSSPLKRRLSKSLVDISSIGSKKAKYSKNKLKRQKQRSKKQSITELKKGSFNLMTNLVINDIKNRPKRLIKPSKKSIHDSSWTSEAAIVKPSTSVLSKKEKHESKNDVETYLSSKDFRNQMLYDGRIKREDTKKLLKKKGYY